MQFIRHKNGILFLVKPTESGLVEKIPIDLDPKTGVRLVPKSMEK